MKLETKFLGLIKDFMLHFISFNVISFRNNIIEMSAGFNQTYLIEVLRKHKIKYEYKYGHYWWSL